MTVFVNDAATTILAGLTNMKAAMIEDYAKFMPLPSRTPLRR